MTCSNEHWTIPQDTSFEEAQMRRGVIGCIAAACALALAASGTAFARAGDRTMVATYPVATALCAKARTGEALPPRLANARAGVVLACNTLENAFGPLVSTVDAAEAAYLTTVSNQRSIVAAACARPVADRAACQAARITKRGTDAAALLTRKAAVDVFRNSIRANRDTFWATIRALRTGA
jgi:hypothetical protein